ncbi:O-antigen ligase family protein [Actinoplanes sp. NEAU-A12]|uniref:O-antigen ligase family protein n=1 Tax=Actinoplanes sandaracinus TaxID=3045177 RepID=A0ABT6WC25_9ACTN|nr:O-antigen ligase family protein [Actinoplanes sandaracinus]MDI6097296.1 O-antigen ligase family protein [Actinoplanes sandaracinus]
MNRAFLAPGLLLILVAIGGRYTLDRAGLLDLAWVDLRVIGLVVALVALAVDASYRPRSLTRPREGWLLAALLFFLFQIASALWAPPAARIGPQTLDLVLLGVLVIAFYQYSIGDPETVTRFTFHLLFITAIVYALAAIFISGPGEQGRYSAFGGGPNVFARIEVLGVISAVALFMLTGRVLPLLVIPLFLLATVLSGSRGTLVAGAVVGFAALLKLRHRLRAGAIVAAAVVSVVAVGAIWAFAPPAFTDLFQERFVEQTVQEQYLSGRTDIWMAALQLFADHPIGGSGLDGFYGLIGVNQAVEYPHNYVLAVAAEGGLAGLGLLTASIVLWTRIVRGGGVRPQATGLAVAAAVFVALSGLFSGDYYDSRLAWMFAALAAASASVRAPAVSKELAVAR